MAATPVGDPRLVEHDGRILKTTGDGLLASVVEAVRAAVKIQQALGVRSDSADGDRRMALRIGVHVGAAAFRKAAGLDSD